MGLPASSESCVAAGVGHVTPHDLRRTHGSLARLGAAEPNQVADGIDHVVRGGAESPETRPEQPFPGPVRTAGAIGTAFRSRPT